MDLVKTQENASPELGKLAWCISREKHAELANTAKQNDAIAKYFCATVGEAMKARPNTTAEVKIDPYATYQLIVIGAMLDVSAKKYGFDDEKNPILSGADMLAAGLERDVWEWAAGVARAFEDWAVLKESSPAELEALSYEGEAADFNIAAILLRVIIESAARMFVNKFKAQLDCEPTKAKKYLTIKGLMMNEALRNLNVGARPVADEFFTVVFRAGEQLSLIKKAWGQDAAKKEKEAAKADKEAAKKKAPKKGKK